ncbi:HTH domain-containing protein [Microbacterium rhizomatis]|uniref:Uncharacterized protein n=1 Tax=Microbacterium rhizomatis TaxID=1631477 RepID=A0A5J5J474_9MICO|nr:HTH domain-containing protein [Microbacterium rhizomatis]KAA9108048.1 hypothetical protein F6B43_11565 [Microbacterium rhizomatis]
MMTQGTSVTADLRRLIAEDRLSAHALQAMTQIDAGKLDGLLTDTSSLAAQSKRGEHALLPEESARISVLTAQLAYGMDIDDDERLRGIVESLTAECGLTLRNIARLTGLDIEDLGMALTDPGSLPSETKYILALRGSHLINAVNLARPR